MGPGACADEADAAEQLLAFFILSRPAWLECHKMATVRRVVAETQEAPGK
jgi:hypothetical protein